jgi:SNF2 family DNA or RNA helicase
MHTAMMTNVCYSRTIATPVQLLARHTLWGQELAEVYVPTQGQSLTLPANDLIPLADAPLPSRETLLVTLAAARIRATLNEGTLLAPLTANVTPLPHQLSALRRAMETQYPRLLLADEVGLGKTIEAGLIMHELKQRGIVRRTLVVAPTGLTRQWQQEMLTHFNETFHLLSPADFPTLRQQPGDPNLWRRYPQIICPLDSVKPIEKRRGWSTEQITRYNAERLDDLSSAGWDLVIFDEAHRLAGSDEQVARYQLARTLADSVPLVLLLSATPHSGKTDAFRRLLSLLDQHVFPPLSSIERERVAPYIIRTPKREATNADGSPLFCPRQTRLLPVVWQQQHSLQQSLYEAVSDYVRTGYNVARRERHQAIGFLLVLMQRLVSSSTRAIRETLERRLALLSSDTSLVGAVSADVSLLADDWADLDSESRLDTVLTSVTALRGEQQEVETLLTLARRCEATGPDARAEALLNQLYHMQQETNNPQGKVLVFTEFTATQAMLQQFLQIRGFSVAILNGRMNREEREAAQQTFANDTQILISTDAGGEGLNLQFCNIVVNYDLPWNPMRLEQRIGRVDRIGQTQTVQAINLILSDTIEGRVQEVLSQKLSTILEEFGVDKTTDVLDSVESDQAVEHLYLHAISNPDTLNQQVETFLDTVRQHATAVHESTAIYQPTDPSEQSATQHLANQLEEHPLPSWLTCLTISAVQAEGGTVQARLGGYDLTWADGTHWAYSTFNRHNADARGARLRTLQEPRLRALLEQPRACFPGQTIPSLRVAGIPASINGTWSLWEIAAHDGAGIQTSTLLPLFQHNDQRWLDPTAHWLWDALLRSSTSITVYDGVRDTLANDAYTTHYATAEQRGASLYTNLITRIQQHLDEEQKRGTAAYQARRLALERIGLANVRQSRLRELAREEATWMKQLQQRRQIQPSLTVVLILRVESL